MLSLGRLTNWTSKGHIFYIRQVDHHRILLQIINLHSFEELLTRNYDQMMN